MVQISDPTLPRPTSNLIGICDGWKGGGGSMHAFISNSSSISSSLSFEDNQVGIDFEGLYVVLLSLNRFFILSSSQSIYLSIHPSVHPSTFTSALTLESNWKS